MVSQIRAFQLIDYKQACEWWASHKWTSVPLESLPEDGFIISNDDGLDIACCWLYRTNSNIAWMEFLISNPDSSKEDRNICLPLLIDKVIDTATHLGYKNVFTSVRIPALIKRLNDKGFIVTDTRMSNLIRGL